MDSLLNGQTESHFQAVVALEIFFLIRKESTNDKVKVNTILYVVSWTSFKSTAILHFLHSWLEAGAKCAVYSFVVILTQMC